MKAQLLLTRHPIICRKCMHGHQVEVITDRMNSPVEYHCGYCGNYAIVGVPARWPFMEITKAEKQPDIGIPASARPDNTGSSPLQVGESLRKKEEIMFTCKHDGCDKWGAVAGYCNSHFKEAYGITVEQYRTEKTGRKEDPETVAERVRRYSLAARKARMERAKETFHAALEEEKEKHPAKPPTPPVTGIPTTGKDEETQLEFEAPVPARAILIPPEMYERIEAMAEAEFRTPDLQVRYLLHKGMEADKAVRG
jgi:hypothetical protein